MAVEMIIDHWNPSKRRYRTETFCYGPRACPLYRSGPERKVPGRHGMSYTEEDWVDDEETSRRGPDESNPRCRLQRQNIQMRDLYHPLNSCGAQPVTPGTDGESETFDTANGMVTLSVSCRRTPAERGAAYRQCAVKYDRMQRR
jgi:hypothetical protein